jgi:hypothetical protein
MPLNSIRVVGENLVNTIRVHDRRAHVDWGLYCVVRACAHVAGAGILACLAVHARFVRPVADPHIVAVNTNIGSAPTQREFGTGDQKVEHVLEQIALAHPKALVIFPESLIPEWSAAHDARWASAFAQLNSQRTGILIGTTIPIPNTAASRNVLLSRGYPFPSTAACIRRVEGFYRPPSAPATLRLCSGMSLLFGRVLRSFPASASPSGRFRLRDLPGFVAPLSCLCQGDHRVLAKGHQFFPAIEFIGPPPQLSSGWCDSEKEAIRIAQTVWLVSGLRFPYFRIGQRHKIPPLKIPLLEKYPPLENKIPLSERGIRIRS